MRLIEFKNEIKLFNDRNNVFKIILDEDFKEEPYHDFRRYTGVFARSEERRVGKECGS